MTYVCSASLDLEVHGCCNFPFSRRRFYKSWCFYCEGKIVLLSSVAKQRVILFTRGKDRMLRNERVIQKIPRNEDLANLSTLLLSPALKNRPCDKIYCVSVPRRRLRRIPRYLANGAAYVLDAAAAVMLRCINATLLFHLQMLPTLYDVFRLPWPGLADF